LLLSLKDFVFVPLTLLCCFRVKAVNPLCWVGFCFYENGPLLLFPQNIKLEIYEKSHTGRFLSVAWFLSRDPIG